MLAFDSSYIYVLKGCKGQSVFYKNALEKIDRAEFLIESVIPNGKDTSEYKMAVKDTPKIKKRIRDLIDSTGVEPPSDVCLRLTVWMGFIVNNARKKTLLFLKAPRIINNS